MTQPRLFCADVARENDEPLAATASRIDHWFLIEYRGLWARDALSGSGISDQVKQHLRDQVSSVRHGRYFPSMMSHITLVSFRRVVLPGS